MLGVATAVRRRSAEALCLSLSAFLIYLVFYGSYPRVVDRYLWVLDFFAAPVAGLGVAFLAERALGLLREPRARRRAAGALLIAAFLAGALATGRSIRHPGVSVRVDDARRLREDLISRVPPDARLLGTPFLGEIALTFAGDRLDVDRRRDPPAHLEAALREGQRVYLLSAPGRVRRAVEGRWDLEPVAVFPSSRHGLPAAWERVFLDRVRARPPSGS